MCTSIMYMYILYVYNYTCAMNVYVVCVQMNSVEKSGWLYKTGPKTGPTNKV